jgi:hypothetical protein
MPTGDKISPVAVSNPFNDLRLAGVFAIAARESAPGCLPKESARTSPQGPISATGDAAVEFIDDHSFPLILADAWRAGSAANCRGRMASSLRTIGQDPLLSKFEDTRTNVDQA